MATGKRLTRIGMVVAGLMLALAALAVIALAAGSGDDPQRRPAARPSPSPAPPPPEPPDRAVTAEGEDAGDCVPTAPCRTLTYVDTIAQPGDVVEVAAGSYPAQELVTRHGSGRRGVVLYRPAAGAGVEVEYLSLTGSGIEVRDFATRGWSVTDGARGITLRNIEARGAVFITSASRVRVIGGSVGPGDSKDSQIKAEDTEGARVPTDILIDGVDFHDWTREADPGAHVECLQVGGARRLVIRNSKFRNCATQDLFIRSWGGTAGVDDILIENNWFDATEDGFYSVRVSTTTGMLYDGIALRYNTSLQSLLVDEAAATDVSFVGNVAPRTAHTCFEEQEFRHNAWEGTTCSDTDRDVPLGLVDPEQFDLRLADGAGGIDAGDPADFPARDRSGESRPKGTAPDAGATER